MKKQIILIFYFIGFYGYCQGFEHRKLSVISIEDSLLNKGRFKRQLIEKEFSQIIGDTSDYNNLYCSIKLCTDYFLYYTKPQGIDSNILDNLKKISRIYINERIPLLLTTGTDGDCGRGCQNLDLLTKNYNFIYVPVGDLSCSPGRIDLAISAFNSETITYLNNVNSNNWEAELEKRIKKIKIRHEADY